MTVGELIRLIGELVEAGARPDSEVVLHPDLDDPDDPLRLPLERVEWVVTGGRYAGEDGNDFAMLTFGWVQP